MTNQAIREPPAMSDVKLFAYLQEMARQINFALQQAETGQARAIDQAASRAETAARTAAGSQANQLRALIVQTADIVEREMDEMSTRLEGSYITRSEWGTIEDNLRSEIQATAESITQQYDYSSEIQGLRDDFSNYRTTTSQYIKTGLLYYEGTLPRYGVAVGENLSTQRVDGEDVLTRNDLCATFTSDRLSFWQGGVEVAYVSNNRLYISNIDVLGTLKIGHWEISHNSGFTLRYVGG